MLLKRAREKQFKKEEDAIWSACLDLSLDKQEFRKKIGSGEYKLLSKLNRGVEWVRYKGTDKDFGKDGNPSYIINLEGKCIGTEYLVEY